MRAILVGVRTDQTERDFKFSVSELEGLIEAAEGQVLGKVYQKRDYPDPAYYIGKGKAQEISKLVEGIEADTVVFNVNLSPVQISNLKEIIGVEVLDRTDLILMIFLKRAKTKQAKLQVELAYLQHQLPRIYGSKGKDLSRIGGGMKTRGAGEQIGEIKTRRIKERITKIKRELEEIKKQRKIQRKSREDNPDILKISLVGYTNAGKSSLLKRLSKKDIFVSDMLFATLDTKTSQLYFPDIKKKALITDTVGFVENMPQELMDAFMATLEEVKEADIILHLIDISDENWEKKKTTVEKVLEELKVLDKPIIEVMNKMDKVVPSKDLIEEDKTENKLYISTVKGWNIDKLIDLLKRYTLKNRRYIVMENNCVFCKIVNKEIPANVVYEDELIMAFHDIRPQAKVHILIIPKEHIPNNLYFEGRHKTLIGHIILKANEIAKMFEIDKTGFRLIVNTGPDSGQEVFHVHWHLVGGEPLGKLLCK